MGYMGLSCVCDSDNASDLTFVVTKAIVKELNKGLKEPGNSFNTCGPVNVGLFLEEYILPIKDLYWSEDFYKLVVKTRKKIQDLIKRVDEEDWGDKDNKAFHVGSYQRIVKSLDKIIGAAP